MVVTSDIVFLPGKLFTNIMVTPTPLDISGQIKKGDVVSYDLLGMKTS